MKKLLLLSCSLLVILFISIIGTTTAQTRVPGVSAGDKFYYTSAYTPYNSTNYDPKKQESNALLEHLELYVRSVSGSTIHFENTILFKNGTTIASSGSVDVKTGDFSGEQVLGWGVYMANNEFLWAFVAANLNANDPFYQGYSTKVNETVTRALPIGNIETIHYRREWGSSFAPTDIYYDRGTGAFVEYTGEEYTYKIKESIVGSGSTQSPSPSIPEFQSYIVVSLFVASIILTAILRRKAWQKKTNIANIKNWVR